MGIAFPPLWGGVRMQQMNRVADTWQPVKPIRTVELPPPPVNHLLPVKWKPPLPIIADLPRLAPSVSTAKYFGPQLKILPTTPRGHLFEARRAAAVKKVPLRDLDLGLWDNVGIQDWDIVSGELLPLTDGAADGTESDKRRFTIQRHPSWAADDVPGQDNLPWYVEEVTFDDARDDYGRTATHAEAVTLVSKMLGGTRHAMFFGKAS